jgi:hypothetical protein
MHVLYFISMHLIQMGCEIQYACVLFYFHAFNTNGLACKVKLVHVIKNGLARAINL